MNRLPSGKKNPQVVRPFPLFRSLTSLPSTFMLKIWSHSNGGRVDWKIVLCRRRKSMLQHSARQR